MDSNVNVQPDGQRNHYGYGHSLPYAATGYHTYLHGHRQPGGNSDLQQQQHAFGELDGNTNIQCDTESCFKFYSDLQYNSYLNSYTGKYLYSNAYLHRIQYTGSRDNEFSDIHSNGDTSLFFDSHNQFYRYRQPQYHCNSNCHLHDNPYGYRITKYNLYSDTNSVVDMYAYSFIHIYADNHSTRHRDSDGNCLTHIYAYSCIHIYADIHSTKHRDSDGDSHGNIFADTGFGIESN